MVVGILGKKFAGKDTLAKTIQLLSNDEITILHFADLLKQVCVEVFKIEMSHFVIPELKEKDFNQPLIIDDYLKELNERVGLEIAPKKLIAQNPRQLMQYVGTEYVRSVKDSYWVDKTLEQITDPYGRLYCIADVRMLNEAKAIQDLPKSMLIKLIRKSDSASDGHKSEVEQEQIKPTATYLIPEGDFLFFKYLAETVVAGFRLDRHVYGILTNKVP